MPAVETPICDFGRPAPDFTLPDTEGREHTLADLRGRRGLLIMFLSNHCPYVKATLPRIIVCARQLITHGIGSAAIMSNDTESYPADSLENMRMLAREREFPFPYLYDESQQVARAYDAVCTPDFFGYNAAGLLQYRGRLDSGRIEAPPVDTPRELFDAMVQVARTGSGPSEQIPSIGCSVKWREG